MPRLLLDPGRLTPEKMANGKSAKDRDERYHGRQQVHHVNERDHGQRRPHNDSLEAPGERLATRPCQVRNKSAEGHAYGGVVPQEAQGNL